MIDYEEFQKIVIEKLNRDISSESNPEQNQSISAPTSDSQFIVAGPCSEETTFMGLKILKFIFVDDIPTKVFKKGEIYACDRFKSRPKRSC